MRAMLVLPQRSCKEWSALVWSKDNLAPRSIWHLREFGTQDNLAPPMVEGQLGNATIEKGRPDISRQTCVLDSPHKNGDSLLDLLLCAGVLTSSF